MSQITTLTSDQQQRLAQVYEGWLAAGKNCEPLDRAAVTRLMAEWYRAIRKTAPLVLFFSSPAMCLLARSALCTKRALWGVLRDRLNEPFATLHNQLIGQLDDQVDRDTLRDGGFRARLGVSPKEGLLDLRRQLSRHLCERTKAQLGSQLWSQLDRVLRGDVELRNSAAPVWMPFLPGFREPEERQFVLWDQTWRYPHERPMRYLPRLLASDSSYGLGNFFVHDGWSAAETLFRFLGEIGIRYSSYQAERLDLSFRSSRELHCWAPFDGVVLCSERHSPPLVDAEGWMHAAPGLACAYRDGFGVAAWHGIVISHKQLNAGPAVILAERNIEQRRVLMERYDSIHGKGQFIQDVGARVIDSAVQPMRPGEPDQINELLSVDLPGDPEARLVALKVIDPSTGRQYVLRVPPGLTSVRSALAWTFGVSAEVYNLEQES